MGIYDYRYASYALGDTLTWQMNALVSALDAGATAIDQVLVVDPARPASWMQPHIGTGNYRMILQNIFPAFLCSPLLRGFRLFRERAAFNLFLVAHLLRGGKTYPTVANHWQQRMRAAGPISTLHGGFPLTHSLLNAFHREHGYLPRLVAPRGYEHAASAFLDLYARDKTVVTIHIRQSRLSSTPSSLHRDSAMDEWLGFFKQVGKSWPDVTFIVLGGYEEWERPLLFIDNVVIPRVHGLNLGHELALLHQSDLFMGTSSGFSSMATFSTVPYVIVNMEHDFAKYGEVSVGAPCYPFALDQQTIYWEKETTATLLAFFEQAYRVRRKRAGHHVSQTASKGGAAHEPARKVVSDSMSDGVHSFNTWLGRRFRRLALLGHHLFALLFRAPGGREAVYKYFWRKAMLPIDTLVALCLAGLKRLRLSRALSVNRVGYLPPSQRNPERAFLAFAGTRTSDGSSLPRDLTLCVDSRTSGRDVDMLFSLFCVCPGTRNFHLFWESPAPVDHVGPLLTANERRRAMGGELPLRELSDATGSLPIPSGSLDIPAAAKDEVRRYLWQLQCPSPVVTASIDGSGQAGCYEIWDSLFASISRRYPRAVILLLSTMNYADSQLLPPYVRCVGNMGVGVIERMALAQEADVYVGRLDEFGATAWMSGRPGLYCVEREEMRERQGDAELPSADGRTVLVSDALAANGLSTLDRALERMSPRGPRSTHAPAAWKPNAHGFLKLWERRDLIVALNPGGGSVGGTIARSKAIALARRIREECPSAVICLLTDGQAEQGQIEIKPEEPPICWTSAVFGSSARDFSALARFADVYIGELDDYGRAAFLTGSPGVYTEGPPYSRQLIRKDLDADSCLDTVQMISRSRIPQRL